MFFASELAGAQVHEEEGEDNGAKKRLKGGVGDLWPVKSRPICNEQDIPDRRKLRSS